MFSLSILVSNSGWSLTRLFRWPSGGGYSYLRPRQGFWSDFAVGKGHPLSLALRRSCSTDAWISLRLERPTRHSTHAGAGGPTSPHPNSIVFSWKRKFAKCQYSSALFRAAFQMRRGPRPVVKDLEAVLRYPARVFARAPGWPCGSSVTAPAALVPMPLQLCSAAALSSHARRPNLRRGTGAIVSFDVWFDVWFFLVEAREFRAGCQSSTSWPSTNWRAVLKASSSSAHSSSIEWWNWPSGPIIRAIFWHGIS